MWTWKILPSALKLQITLVFVSSSSQSGSQILCQYLSCWYPRQTRFPSYASASHRPQQRIQTADSLTLISSNSTTRCGRRGVRHPICVSGLLKIWSPTKLFFFYQQKVEQRRQFVRPKLIEIPLLLPWTVGVVHLINCPNPDMSNCRVALLAYKSGSRVLTL